MKTQSEAFAEQAASDLDAYEVLVDSNLPSSHRLHYLQMWLEKLCKAYLWLPGAAADELRTKHNVVDKVLPRMISEHWRRIGFDQRPDMAAIRQTTRTKTTNPANKAGSLERLHELRRSSNLARVGTER